jgi:hypothetical protein
MSGYEVTPRRLVSPGVDFAARPRHKRSRIKSIGSVREAACEHEGFVFMVRAGVEVGHPPRLMRMTDNVSIMYPSRERNGLNSAFFRGLSKRRDNIRVPSKTLARVTQPISRQTQSRLHARE